MVSALVLCGGSCPTRRVTIRLAWSPALSRKMTAVRSSTEKTGEEKKGGPKNPIPGGRISYLYPWTWKAVKIDNAKIERLLRRRHEVLLKMRTFLNGHVRQVVLGTPPPGHLG